jgi:hypothetical protein
LLTHPPHHIHDQRAVFVPLPGTFMISSPTLNSFSPRASESKWLKCCPIVGK